jgi:hypothetical protein
VSLKLYPDARTASIRIVSDEAFMGAYTFTRTDRNGTAPVRLKAAQSPRRGISVRDYEAALSGPVTYTLKTENTTYTAETALDGTLSQHVTSDVLTHVQRPEKRFIPTLTLGHESSRQSKNTVHEVVGRADPLVVRGPLSTRRGTLEFLALDAAAATRAEALNDVAGPLFFRFADGVSRDLYFEAEAVAVTFDQDRWRVRIEYIEVARPKLLLEGGTGLTYGELKARHGVYAEVQERYATYADLIEAQR